MDSAARALTQAAPEDIGVERLLQLIAAMLRELRPAAHPRPVGLDDSIERDLGLDSLSRAELVLRIERAFGVRLPEQLAVAARTPRDLVAALGKAERTGDTAPWAEQPAVPLPEVAGTPDEAQTIVDVFRWHLERHPEREHITLLVGDDATETISYARLYADASAMARGLAAAGILPGDPVAIMLPTGAAFFQIFLGALLIGAVPVPLYPPFRWSQIEEHVRGRAAILANCEAAMLVTVPEAMFVGRVVRAELPKLRAVMSPDDLRESGGSSFMQAGRGSDTALLQYTSGSTGDPKGVILQHATLLANIRAIGRGAAATSHDRFVSWLPLYHDMGLIGAWLATMYHAVPLTLMSPASFLARPARWLWAIHRFRGTISAGPNFAYEIVAAKVRDEELAGLDLSCWRLAFNGAEPVRAGTLEKFAARFALYGFDRRALTPVYGLAESAVGLAFPPLGRGPFVERIDPRALARDGVAIAVDPGAPNAVESVSCGRPLAGHEIRIVDDSRREAPARSEGRVEFRGPSATVGYFRNPGATAKLIHDGWLDTGDVGYIAGGELFLTSRAKDLIKRGGHNLHPYDLEAAIGDVPGIRKGCVAVFGTADRTSGTERVIVVAETNESEPSARSALAARITELATVHLNGPADEVLLVPPHTVLKTSSGKIRRSACRELYESGLVDAPRPAVWSQMARLFGHALVASVRRGMRSAGRTAYGVYVWLLFLTAGTLALVVLAVLPGEPRRIRATRLAMKALIRLAGIPLRVEGLGHIAEGVPLVIIANHSSYVDALVLTAVLPGRVHYAAMRELAHAPLLGFGLRRLGTYFVERSDPARGIEDARELAAAVARGECVVFFPEGTFSRAPGLAPFRLGAFAVSAESGAPILPVVLRGTRSLLREHRWLPARNPVEVSVLPAMLPDGKDWSAAVRLRDAARAVVLAHCGEPDLASSSG